MDSYGGIRGVIHNRERKKQIISYEGMVYTGAYGTNNVTPTDIDGLIEIKNKIYIFIEIKYGNNEIPNGQKYAMQSLCDSINSINGKHSIFIHAKHNVKNPTFDVIAGRCEVVKYYSESKKWMSTDRVISLKEICDRFVSRYTDEIT